MKAQHARSYLWLFWTLAVVGLALDQTSKYGIFAALYEGPGKLGSYSVVPDVFRLTADYSTQPVPDDWLRPLRAASADYMPRVNHGALFGLWSRDESGNDGNSFFSVVSLLAAAAIMVWMTRTSASRDLSLSVSLGLILAGTLGNFYDRIVFHGVRDFLHWYYLVDWPVFNIADCCLVCGASLLLVQALFLQPNPSDDATKLTSRPAELSEVVDVK